jgi:hypothetical protein
MTGVLTSGMRGPLQATSRLGSQQFRPGGPFPSPRASLDRYSCIRHGCAITASKPAAHWHTRPPTIVDHLTTTVVCPSFCLLHRRKQRRYRRIGSVSALKNRLQHLAAPPFVVHSICSTGGNRYPNHPQGSRHTGTGKARGTIHFSSNSSVRPLFSAFTFPSPDTLQCNQIVPTPGQQIQELLFPWPHGRETGQGCP